MFGLEMHLVTIHKLVNQFRPRIVVIDPITNFTTIGSDAEIKAMLTRLIDFFKMQHITALFTSLTVSDTLTESMESMESNDVGVSALMDSWLLLRDVKNGAERNRVLHLLKSRGMAHSNQVREFLLTDHGAELRDVYVGPSGVLLTGSARMALEAQEKDQVLERRQEIEGKNRELDRKRQAMEAQIAVLRAEFEVEQAEAAKTIGQDQTRAGVLAGDRVQMAQVRRFTMTTKPKTDLAKATPAKPADLWKLRLYVAGQTPKSLVAFANLKRLCEDHLQGRYTIEVIDLVETPRLAKDDQILAIPTLVRRLPEPVRKIIGDLSNTERVLVGLDLIPKQ
jgi:hypothetical protein